MSMNLPEPIADYIKANARLDIDGMLKPFLSDALFIDNGKHFEGQTAIRHLFEEEGGDIVVEGPAHGDFPGSPLRFTYRFMLVRGAIKTLEVTI